MPLNYSGPICCPTHRSESWTYTTDNKLTTVVVISAEMQSQACTSHEQAPLLQQTAPDVIKAGINFLPLNVEGFWKNKDIALEQLFAFLEPKPIAILFQKTHVQDVNKLKIARYNLATYITVAIFIVLQETLQTVSYATFRQLLLQATKNAIARGCRSTHTPT